jgi:hypothetical protein
MRYDRVVDILMVDSSVYGERARRWGVNLTSTVPKYTFFTLKLELSLNAYVGYCRISSCNGVLIDHL